MQNSKFKNFTLYIVILIFTFYILHLTPPPAYADCNPSLPVEQRGADCPAGLDQIEAMVANVISVIVGLGFMVMLVLIVMAGFKYLTSGGEPKAIQAAHQTLTWALLGVVFMAIAWLILQLIGGFTGIPVTVFDIKALCKLGDNPLKFCQ